MDKKRSLGRDVFQKAPAGDKSDAVRKMLEKPARGPARAREVEVRIKLTPSNIKHLDAIRAELQKGGKGKYSRSEMIRVAIALLSANDF